MCGSTREWIYCILDIVHILKRMVHLCRLSEYFYTYICCDWISKSSQDKDSLCHRILNRSQDTDICVSGHQTDHMTDHRTVTVARSEWFHYCIIVCTVESIPVDCNLYF